MSQLQWKQAQVKFKPQHDQYDYINQITTQKFQTYRIHKMNSPIMMKQKKPKSQSISTLNKSIIKQNKKGDYSLSKKKTSEQKTNNGVQNEINNNQNRKINKIIHIQRLILLFVQKLSYNNIFRKPIEFDPLEDTNFQRQPFLFSFLGKFSIHENLQTLINVLRLCYIITYLFLLPLLFIFQEIHEYDLVIAIKIIGIIANIYDIMQISRNNQIISKNITREAYNQLLRNQKNKILKHLFIIVCIIMSIVLFHYNKYLSSSFFFFAILNLNYYFKCLPILEQKFFEATHYENYWKLFKVLMINFIVGHIIACVLLSITFFEPANNWMHIKGINQNIWYEKYIWSYYFGTTIFLTIGFGDLYPNNPVQALFVVIVSFLGCVFFGYNINCMGNLINSIRQQQLEKINKLKIVNSIAKKSQLSKDTLSEITNYITQQSRIKKQFNQDQEKKIIQELPQTLRSSFLREVNHNLFNELKTIVSFSNETIQNLSLSIQAKICHPNQIIKKKNSTPSLIILQFGQVGFIARKYNSKFNNHIIQRISIKSDKAKIICSDILTQKNLNYDIRSQNYSAIHQISKQQFQKCLKLQNKDYQLYRQIVDETKFKLDQYDTIYCQFCKQRKHTHFQCPKMHFIPFKDHVSRKNKNQIIKNDLKQKRLKFQRKKRYTYAEYIKQQFFQQQLISQINSNTSNNVSLEKLTSLNMIEKPKQSKQKHVRLNSILQYITNKQNDDNSKKTNYQNTSKSSRTIQMISQIKLDIEKIKNNNQIGQVQLIIRENQDLDVAYNFSHYFPSNNPDNLKQNVIKMKTINSKLGKSTRKKITYKNLK